MDYEALYEELSRISGALSREDFERDHVASIMAVAGGTAKGATAASDTSALPPFDVSPSQQFTPQEQPSGPAKLPPRSRQGCGKGGGAYRRAGSIGAPAAAPRRHNGKKLPQCRLDHGHLNPAMNH
mmetsp:Transcript_34834/g.97729  ORF Transcript_34834/g.97729 Transcript_34834/m.97729 type:complete len:126 (-) Transcript_34834:60-437(-)